MRLVNGTGRIQLKVLTTLKMTMQCSQYLQLNPTCAIASIQGTDYIATLQFKSFQDKNWKSKMTNQERN